MSQPQGNGRQLALAVMAFTATFYGWALLGPLGPDLQDDLGLSDVQLSIAVAVPVLLGSLMRIPMGVLTERFGSHDGFCFVRSATRITSFSPDHTASTAHTFTSTKPSGSAAARIASSVTSVGTFDAFFGHETQITPFGARDAFNSGSRAARSALVVTKR